MLIVFEFLEAFRDGRLFFFGLNRLLSNAFDDLDGNNNPT